MSKKRNKSGGPVDVGLLGRQVEDGEVVEVPDFQPASTEENPLPIDWPDRRWEPVPDDTPLGVPESAAKAPKAAKTSV